MDRQSFGKIEKVPTQDHFPTEREFTSWLAHNLDELGKILGFELEAVTVERSVGPFSADLVCRIVGTDKLVVIENQFGNSDHGHLGKLLTYASGLEAQYVVWLAEVFTEQHRSVFEWLNENTTRDMKAFAATFHLERIGESLPAPRFELIEKPNDWVKNQKVGLDDALSPKQKMYMDFWRGLDEYIKGSGLVSHGDPNPNYWRRFEIGRPGFFLTVVVWDRRDEEGLVSELTIRGGNRVAYFNSLRKRKDEIENSIGEELDWAQQKDGPQSVIASYGDFESWEQKHWPLYYKWFKNELTKFHRTFRPLVITL